MAKKAKLIRQLDEAQRYLRPILGKKRPQVLLVLGSGWNHVAAAVKKPLVVPYADVPHLCASTVEEHVGQFVYGKLGGKRVLVMQGRLHGYEGYSAQQVAFPVWLANRLGAGVLFTTNAAGGIDAGLVPGDFCVMSDQINFTGRNPAAGQDACALGPRFFSMEGAFDAQLRRCALDAAAAAGIRAQEGVYLGLLGPSFETPAEIRAFSALGASTVAMSVCEEVIAARQVGMRVLGVSMVSNYASGLGPDPLGQVSLGDELASVFAIAGDAAVRLVRDTVRTMEL